MLTERPSRVVFNVSGRDFMVNLGGSKSRVALMLGRAGFCTGACARFSCGNGGLQLPNFALCSRRGALDG
eukprot:11205339-Lingulodinium_polyedra.AAC.1